MISQSYKLARRIVVGVVGATVVLLGMAMIVLPGPAFIVIPIGLAILGIEFTWARRWLRVLRSKVQSTFNARRRIR
ncbi:MAG: PGPGW domain-containing protein [Pseudomonadota bacterium]|nr:PGPGW domain-containing protein [Pseudomonadota bacterium]